MADEFFNALFSRLGEVKMIIVFKGIGLTRGHRHGNCLVPIFSMINQIFSAGFEGLGTCQSTGLLIRKRARNKE